MSDLNLNKIAGAVILAGLIGMVAGKASELLYFGEFQHKGHHEEGPRGYKIEVVEVAAGGAAAPTGAPDISALYASADTHEGREYFEKKCATCHTVDKGGANKVGPALWGIMGRKVAATPGFSYSKGMSSHADRTWTWEEMNQFQFKPAKWVPGTIMAYAGTSKDQDRANLILYLNKQSDSPLALPPVTAKPEEAAAAEPAKEAAPAAQ
jgi:cytochrome c